ncbi:DUF5662 family protein [Ileibacterium valens]|uniref:DUF5662 family protein n=1 Tax=Ileibacterium valens TaxID=1862668 RepID=UPI000B2FC5FE
MFYSFKSMLLGMNQSQKIIGHLSTINRHKAKVTSLCFRCGLIKQGLLHDLSKYSWEELKTGFKYYQGYRSPIDAQKEAEGCSTSWLHHKGRNKHHWEYWLDHNKDGIFPVKMPFNYVAEMFCDRTAASMTYLKDKYNDSSALEYYRKNQAITMFHPDTEKQLVYLLEYQRDHGLDATLKKIKSMLSEFRKTGTVTLD